MSVKESLITISKIVLNYFFWQRTSRSNGNLPSYIDTLKAQEGTQSEVYS